MKKYILTVTLNPAIDKTVTVSHFRIGRDFREHALFLSAGGKGLNVSRVLGHLGVATCATGFVGGPAGQFIGTQLQKEKIKHDFCQIKGQTRTSTTIIDPTLGTITRVLERGPVVDVGEIARFKRTFSSLLPRAHAVVFSGRSIPGVADGFYGELITLARKYKCMTVFDSSGIPYQRGLAKKPHMIKPNVSEAEQLLGIKLLSLRKRRKAVLDLHKRGIAIVAVTMGSGGVIACNSTEFLYARSPRLEGKSPVGCGDAFIAGFVASHIRGQSFSEAVRLAVACGAANVLSVNPGAITYRTVQKLLRQVTVKSLPR